MELSFCELRAKEVVNICDGRKMGNIIDMIETKNQYKLITIIYEDYYKKS